MKSINNEVCKNKPIENTLKFDENSITNTNKLSMNENVIKSEQARERFSD